jgi:hypothetical protein
MPTFNGQNIFGAQVSMTSGDQVRETQQNNYVGVDGTEEIDCGFRMMETSAKGRLFGLGTAGGQADLVAMIQAFYALKDGNTYPLVDSFGNTWNNVRMASFTLDAEGGIRQTTAGDFYQWYSATFIHLSKS